MVVRVEPSQLRPRGRDVIAPIAHRHGHECAYLSADLGDQVVYGLVLPCAEDDRDELPRPGPVTSRRCQLSKAGCDPGTEQRALTDTAFGIEKREPRGAEMRKDELPLGAPTEEPPGICLGVKTQAPKWASCLGRISGVGCGVQAWLDHIYPEVRALADPRA